MSVLAVRAPLAAAFETEAQQKCLDLAGLQDGD